MSEPNEVVALPVETGATVSVNVEATEGRLVVRIPHPAHDPQKPWRWQFTIGHDGCLNIAGSEPDEGILHFCEPEELVEVLRYVVRRSVDLGLTGY